MLLDAREGLRYCTTRRLKCMYQLFDDWFEYWTDAGDDCCFNQRTQQT